MSDAQAASHPTDEPHHDAPGDHGEDGGHDDHGHGEGTLGPIDWAAWGAGAVGVALGLLVALTFALSTGYLGGTAPA